MVAKKVFDGLCFCITGKLTLSRKELEGIIESRGGRVVDSVSSKVDYVISEKNELKKNTNKILDAKAKGVPILQEGFLDACIKAKSAVAHKKYCLVDPDNSDESDDSDDEEFATTKKKPTKKKAAAKPKKAATKKKVESEEEEEEEEEDEDDDEEEITWYWKDDKGWTAYSKVVSKRLETNYNKDKSKPVKVDEEREVVFKSMVQRRKDDHKKVREIKREVKTTTKRKTPAEDEKSSKTSKKAKIEDEDEEKDEDGDGDEDEDDPVMFVPMNCYAKEWTDEAPFGSPVLFDKLHFGFDKSVSEASKLAQKFEKQMKGVSLDSEASYPWMPFVVKIPKAWVGEGTDPIMIEAILNDEYWECFKPKSFKKTTQNFFSYRTNDTEDEKEGKKDTKVSTSKEMKKSLVDLFVYEYTANDGELPVYPKFVGGYMKDKTRIVGLFSLKVET